MYCNYNMIIIHRHLGRKANLAGDNEWEALQIDIAIDSLSDFRVGKNKVFQYKKLYVFVC